MSGPGGRGHSPGVDEATDQLQQRQLNGPAPLGGFHEHGLFPQGLEDGRHGAVCQGDDRLGVVDRERAPERGELAQGIALDGLQQLPGPGEGVVEGCGVAVAKALQHLGGAQHRAASGGELEGQG